MDAISKTAVPKTRRRERERLAMRIKVKTHGHQVYHEKKGEAVYWCSSVEHYNFGDKSQPMQVPAVLINTGDAVVLVPLQSQYNWTEVEVLSESEDGNV